MAAIHSDAAARERAVIPQRFSVDYPSRTWELYEQSAGKARATQREVSLLLTVAMPLIVIPMERRHPSGRLSRLRDEGGWHRDLENLLKVQFDQSVLWDEHVAATWRYSRLHNTDINNIAAWRDAEGNPPLAGKPKTSAATLPLEVVFGVLRNAMAHGNVVYLDQDGHETPGARVVHLAFVTDGDRGERAARQLLCVTADAFERFLKAWAGWLSSRALPSSLRVAA